VKKPILIGSAICGLLLVAHWLFSGSLGDTVRHAATDDPSKLSLDPGSLADKLVNLVMDIGLTVVLFLIGLWTRIWEAVTDLWEGAKGAKEQGKTSPPLPIPPDKVGEARQLRQQLFEAVLRGDDAEADRLRLLIEETFPTEATESDSNATEPDYDKLAEMVAHRVLAQISQATHGNPEAGRYDMVPPVPSVDDIINSEVSK